MDSRHCSCGHQMGASKRFSPNGIDEEMVFFFSKIGKKIKQNRIVESFDAHKFRYSPMPSNT